MKLSPKLKSIFFGVVFLPLAAANSGMSCDANDYDHEKATGRTVQSTVAVPNTHNIQHYNQ